MFEKLTFEQYNNLLASNAPTPGGGSALAQVGAIACSLIEMSVNVTLTKLDESDEIYDYLQSEKDIATRAKNAMYKLANEDATAFQKIIDCLRLPKETEEQKVNRKRELQKAYHCAAIVPIDTMNLCREVIKRATVRVTPHLNKYVASDCVIGVDLLKTVARNCAHNVYANTSLITDDALKNSLERQGKEILKEIETM